MINYNLLSSSIAPILNAASLWNPLFLRRKVSIRQWLALASAGFLVTVPVFIQAPLVRMFPVASLLSTLAWLGLSLVLLSREKTQFWGDLLLGFTGSWLAGSIYWGWLRWEPFLHLPVESIGVPFAVWCLARSWGKVGSYFYLGSLFGTAVTDLYFYLTGLIGYWRELMRVEPELTMPIFQSAIAQISNPWGISCAIVLIGILLGVGLVHLRFKDLHWWTFSGAVLSTLLVDGLFWVVVSNIRLDN
ncbi:hypothetical protein BCD67_17180 [Oscillatoriales cyanobacterium USR001]|nr:hypothetical protein BCD67_17180 [Oscillatoriales cyanobacterium USR001]